MKNLQEQFHPERMLESFLSYLRRHKLAWRYDTKKEQLLSFYTLIIISPDFLIFYLLFIQFLIDSTALNYAHTALVDNFLSFNHAQSLHRSQINFIAFLESFNFVWGFLSYP